MTQTPPLSGLMVVDFTAMLAGPYCSRLLADTGAEVIKVETQTGDYIRGVAPISAGESTYFAQLNVGKKSIVLDLTEPDDYATARALTARADIVVENFRPGVMKKLGLDYDTLSADNPGLIYCSISGYGQTGPRAKDPAYAPIVHAMSGYDLAMAEAQTGLDGPISTAVQTADMVSGLFAFSAIQTALVGRLRHGNGQFIDVSLMEAMINLMPFDTQLAQNPQDDPRAVYGPIRARDGFVNVAPISQKNFENMARVMGHPEWIDDPRFAETPNRRANWDTLMNLAQDWTIQRDAETCATELNAAGVPCGVYQTLAQAIHDPQIEHRGLMVKIDDAEGGFLVPNVPFTFADGSVRAATQAPGLGEHTDAIRNRLSRHKTGD